MFSCQCLVRFKSDPLAAFKFRVQRGSDPILYEITGWTAKERTGSYRDSVVKTAALATIIFITNWWISYPCFDRRVQKCFICAYIALYRGDSLRKTRHEGRCYFEFAIEVRFSHVSSLIYIDIPESGNGNSPVVNHRLNMLSFCNICIFLWCFRRKMGR